MKRSAAVRNWVSSARSVLEMVSLAFFSRSSWRGEIQGHLLIAAEVKGLLEAMYNLRLRRADVRQQPPAFDPVEDLKDAILLPVWKLA
jgi:hypothetical protein